MVLGLGWTQKQVIGYYLLLNECCYTKTQKQLLA